MTTSTTTGSWFMPMGRTSSIAIARRSTTIYRSSPNGGRMHGCGQVVGSSCHSYLARNRLGRAGNPRRIDLEDAVTRSARTLQVLPWLHPQTVGTRSQAGGRRIGRQGRPLFHRTQCAAPRSGFSRCGIRIPLISTPTPGFARSTRGDFRSDRRIFDWLGGCPIVRSSSASNRTCQSGCNRRRPSTIRTITPTPASGSST